MKRKIVRFLIYGFVLYICFIIIYFGLPRLLYGNQDVDFFGHYKKELSYGEIIKNYQLQYDKEREYLNLDKNVLLAIGLSKYYHLNNKLSDSKDYSTMTYTKNALKNINSLQEIGIYLNIKNDDLYNLRYRFDYYYSPNNSKIFSILRFIMNNKCVAIYYFPNGYDSNYRIYGDFTDDWLYSDVYADGLHLVDGTDLSLHLFDKVMPNYIDILKGKFYPYLYLSKHLECLAWSNEKDMFSTMGFKDKRTFRRLKYYSASRKYGCELYFDMHDLLSNSDCIKGVLAVANSESYNILNQSLVDVFSFTLDASDGIKNCKLKQLSLYN